MLKPTPLP
ncbi:unnamed protein product, partial [Rotaria magnacalcarata]